MKSIVKNSFFVFVFGFISSCGVSDNSSKEISEKGKEKVVVEIDTVAKVKRDEVLDHVRPLIYMLVQDENGLYGYKDSSGLWLIEPKFEYAGAFAEKLAPVFFEGKWLLINKKGATIRVFEKLKPIVWTNELSGEKFVTPITERMLPIEFPDGKFGFLNLEKEKVSPKYDEVRGYTEGLACVRQGEIWGVINHSWNWVLKPKYDGLLSFSCGRAKAWIDNKYGYIDKKGKEIIPLKFGGAFPFQENLAFVTMSDSYLDFFVIDTLGNTILKGIYNSVYGFGFKNGEAEVLLPDGRCVVIDKKGKILRKNKDGCQEGC